MFPRLTEIAYAVYGAWRLARFDEGGHQYFENSPGAFWRSFFAAVLVAPGYIILAVLHYRDMTLGANVPSILIIQALTYCISWMAFPLVSHVMASVIGREDRWVGFVVALNWSKVIQMAVFLPLALLAATGIAGEEGGATITLVGLAAILTYQWFVTRTAFRITGMQAVGFTGVDMVLGIAITSFADATLMR